MTGISGGHVTKRSLVLLQSGGPTAVLNASLVGSITAARNCGIYGSVLGSRNGFEGLLSGSLVDFAGFDAHWLAKFRRTPSAGLGTSRHRPSDAELDQIIERCAELDIAGIVATGGNDTADTVWRLVKRADARNASLQIISLPKTIDNDLMGTDHCLGYGSAARFIALGVRESTFDTIAMADIYPIKIVEVMGRNAGWLAASGSLGLADDLPSPIICLPERPFPDFEVLCERVSARIDNAGFAVLVAPETMRWADGAHVAGTTPEWRDQFGHPYFPSAGHALARRFTERLGVRARYDKPGTLSRMAMHAVSSIDLAEAEQAGIEAVRLLQSGATGVGVRLTRVSSEPYRIRYETTPVSQIANVERRLPDDMINTRGDGVTSAFIKYAMPLLGEPLEPYAILR